jgi:hypothetical protein
MFYSTRNKCLMSQKEHFGSYLMPVGLSNFSQCCGSVTYCYGSGSAPLRYGSGSFSFRQWLSKCQKIRFFLRFFAFYFLNVHLRQSSKIKIYNEAGFRIRIRIGSVFNRVSGSGSVFGIRFRIRIQEGKNDPQK